MFRFSDRVVIKTEINILDTNRASYFFYLFIQALQITSKIINRVYLILTRTILRSLHT